jgi:hypothetical protein
MNLKLSRFFIIKMSLLVASMVVLTLFSLFASPEGAEETGSTIAVMGTLVAAACGGGLLWSIHKYQGTEISDAGVRQVTVRGSLFVPWEDVQALRLFGGAYILDSARGSIIINPKAYEDPFAVAEYVDGHMRKVMEERGAKVVKQPRKPVS